MTGSNAAMRVWAALFKHLPLSDIDLRMPDGANFVWVNMQQNALTDPSCVAAVQIPFIDGTEPGATTACLDKLGKKNRKSLWRKWFDNDGN